jgi:protein TonB
MALAAPPKWVRGGPTGTDNRHGRYRGAVVVQFTVGLDGRASNCVAVRPSGNPDLDTLTCRLVVERSEFAPARDAQGRIVARDVYATYVWGRGRHSKK